jgi:hypothetical protein
MRFLLLTEGVLRMTAFELWLIRLGETIRRMW